MLINSDQCRSISINARSSRIDPALISIDQHSSALIGIDRQWSALIRIDRHWYQLILISIDRQWSALVMRSSKKSTSGSTWPCFVVNIKCFGYAVLPPQFLLMFYWCLDLALVGIEKNWEELIGNDRHWETFRINAMMLIGIDRHWAMIEGVLPWARGQPCITALHNWWSHEEIYIIPHNVHFACTFFHFYMFSLASLHALYLGILGTHFG